MNYTFSTARTTRYRFPTHTNELVMDRSEAAASEVFVVVLEPGEAPPLHRHDDTEQVFFVLEGRGKLEIAGEREQFALTPGDVARIPPSVEHRVHCTGDQPLRYLAIDCFPGGRPDAEPTWDQHVQTVCREQGWDYAAIVGER